MLLKQNLFLTFLLFSIFCYSNKIIIISIPKCGTHLLQKCINLIQKYDNSLSSNLLHLESYQLNTLRNNSLLVSHAFFTQKNKNLILKNNIKIFFIYRDPRDQLVSMIYQIYNYHFHNFLDYLKNKTFDELFYYLMLNYGEIFFKIWNTFCTNNLDIIYQKKISSLEKKLNISEIYQYYLKWISNTEVYSIRFEDLIGERGNGDKYIQTTKIIDIAKHIEIELDEIKAKEIGNKLFGDTWSFREGKISSWKQHFNNQQKIIFKQIAGQLLIDLKYEKDLNW